MKDINYLKNYIATIKGFITLMEVGIDSNFKHQIGLQIINRAELTFSLKELEILFEKIEIYGGIPNSMRNFLIGTRSLIEWIINNLEGAI